MDPEKILAQIKKALGLADDATREQITKALDALAAFQEAKTGDGAGAPAPTEGDDAAAAAASDAGAGARAMGVAADKLNELATMLGVSLEDAGDSYGPVFDAISALQQGAKVEQITEGGAAPAAAASDETSTNTVAAADDAGDATAFADDATAAAAGQLIDALVEATGLDAAGVLAGLQEQIEALTGLLTGAAEGSGDAATEDMAAARAVATSRINALTVKLNKESADKKKLSDRINALELERRTARIDGAIHAGHVLGADREKLVKLAASNPELLEEWLGEASDAPAIPKGKKIGTKVTTPTSVIDDNDPRVQAHVKALSRGGKDPAFNLAVAKHRVAHPEMTARQSVEAVLAEMQKQSTAAGRA